MRTVLWSVVCSLLVMLPRTGQTAGVATFQADLVRDASAGSKSERLEGRVFFDSASDTLRIQVQSPISQWVTVHGKEMLLYYPERRQAYRVLFKGDAAMPFFRIIWNCFKEDFGLRQQGFAMARYDRNGTSLKSMWTPPGALARLIREAILEYEGNRLTRVEYTTARGNLLSRAVFSQHVPVSGYHFPLHVAIRYGSAQGMTDEVAVYSNPRFNAPLPAEVVNMKIPPGVEVKELVW